jgi:hypothetical protein
MARYGFQPLPEEPLVSVLLYTRNHAGTVGDCARGLLAQDYPGLQVIIADDGSRDATVPCLKDLLRDAPFPVEWAGRRGSGEAAARNAAFALARGELVCLLDGACSWAPNKVSAMLDLARQRAEAGIYQHQLLDPQGNPLRERLINRDILRDWVALGEVDVERRSDLVNIFAPAGALMARREVLAKVFPLPERLRSHAAMYIALACCIFGPIATTREAFGAAGPEPERDAQLTPAVMTAVNHVFRRYSVPARMVHAPQGLLQRVQWMGQQLRWLWA